MQLDNAALAYLCFEYWLRFYKLISSTRTVVKFLLCFQSSSVNHNVAFHWSFGKVHCATTKFFNTIFVQLRVNTTHHSSLIMPTRILSLYIKVKPPIISFSETLGTLQGVSKKSCFVILNFCINTDTYLP